MNQNNKWRLRDAKLDTNKHNSNEHNNISCSNLQRPQHPFLSNAAFVDTAATDHYAPIKAPLEQVRTFPNPVPMFLSDGTIMKASHAGVLPNLPQTSTFNKTAQMCPSNNNIVLVSLGKIWDDYCESRINKNLAQFTNKTKQCSQHHIVHTQACTF